MEASQTRDLFARHKRGRSARLARIPFDFAQGRLSAGKERPPRDDGRIGD